MRKSLLSEKIRGLILLEKVRNVLRRYEASFW